MRERRPAPQEHVDERSERHRQRPDDALQLASQMGNVAFTALARSVARQPSEVIEFPPDHVGPGGEVIEVPPAYGPPESGQSGSEFIEFPPDHIGPEGGGQSDSEFIEFPSDYIGPESGGGGQSEYIEFPPDYVGPEN